MLRGRAEQVDLLAVLLNVATHLVPLRAAAARLSESGSSLERRIRIMHSRSGAGGCWLRSLGRAALRSHRGRGERGRTAGSGSDRRRLRGRATAATDSSRGLEETMTHSSRPFHRHFYPQLLTTKQEGRPYVWAVVNERGEYRKSIWMCVPHGRAKRSSRATGRSIWAGRRGRRSSRTS